MPDVHVARLTTTPVKSLALHEVDELDLGPRGAPHDRRFFLVDERRRIFNGLRHGPLVRARADYDGRTLSFRLPDGRVFAGEPELDDTIAVDREVGYTVSGRRVQGPFARALSELAGREVELVRADDERPAWSCHPVSLIGSASIAAVRPEPLEAQRFRMLVEVAGGEPFRVGDAVEPL